MADHGAVSTVSTVSTVGTVSTVCTVSTVGTVSTVCTVSTVGTRMFTSARMISNKSCVLMFPALESWATFRHSFLL